MFCLHDSKLRNGKKIKDFAKLTIIIVVFICKENQDSWASHTLTDFFFPEFLNSNSGTLGILSIYNIKLLSFA